MSLRVVAMLSSFHVLPDIVKVGTSLPLIFTEYKTEVK